MSDYTFTRIVTKPVTIQQEQKETAVLPVLDLDGPVVVEVLNAGKGTVIINGVILKGATVVDIRTTTNTHSLKREGRALLVTSKGNVDVPVTDFVLTDGFEPTTVEWKAERSEGVRCFDCIQSLGGRCNYHRVAP